VLLEGRFPSGCDEYSLTRTVLQPESYAYGLFDLYWRQLGGELKGSWRVQIRPEGDQEAIYVHRSRPLGDLIRMVK
jgi:D-alanyl-D-alanine carboxypeptidase/D-alanyl-D-alanine-endopeptidase (penicillin-binding protein 4)